MSRIDRSLSLAALLALALSGAAHGEEPPTTSKAEIPFADLGGIRNWRAEGNRAIDIESARGEWFHATFAAPCDGLQFRDTVAFVTAGPNVLDRFGSVIVRGGERCYFETFERMPAAPDIEEPDEED
jgi:hypothetical protein